MLGVWLTKVRWFSCYCPAPLSRLSFMASCFVGLYVHVQCCSKKPDKTVPLREQCSVACVKCEVFLIEHTSFYSRLQVNHVCFGKCLYKFHNFFFLQIDLNGGGVMFATSYIA